MKAQRIGRFRQVDTYFEVPRGRLKLREIENEPEAKLVYYERADVAEPKKSDVFILRIRETASFKKLITKILKIRTVVKKEREIYQYGRTRIHLDTVEGLGIFIEFERRTSDDPQAVRKNKGILRELMRKLDICPENLEKLSYSDLIQLNKESKA